MELHICSFQSAGVLSGQSRRTLNEPRMQAGGNWVTMPRPPSRLPQSTFITRLKHASSRKSASGHRESGWRIQTGIVVSVATLSQEAVPLNDGLDAGGGEKKKTRMAWRRQSGPKKSDKQDSAKEAVTASEPEKVGKPGSRGEERRRLGKGLFERVYVEKELLRRAAKPIAGQSSETLRDARNREGLHPKRGPAAGSSADRGDSSRADPVSPSVRRAAGDIGELGRRVHIPDVVEGILKKHGVDSTELATLIRSVAAGRKGWRGAESLFWWSFEGHGGADWLPSSYEALVMIGALGVAGQVERAKAVFEAMGCVGERVKVTGPGAETETDPPSPKSQPSEATREAGTDLPRQEGAVREGTVPRSGSADEPAPGGEVGLPQWKGMTGTDRRTVHVYNAMMAAYGRAGRVREAFALWQSLPERGVRPNAATYSTVVSIVSSQGDSARLQEVLKAMATARFRPDTVVTNALISACTSCRMYDEALGWFERLLRSPVCGPDVVTYTAALEVYARLGHSAEAENLVERMKAQDVKPNVVTYSALMRCYVARGSAEKAEEVIAQMELAGCRPNAVTFNILMDAYKGARDPEGAVAVLARMEAAGCAPTLVSYNTVIGAYSRAGRAEEAFEWLQRLRDARLQPDTITFCELIDACGRQGNLEAAEDLFSLVQRHGLELDAAAVTSMMSAYARLQMPVQAGRLYEDMRARGMAPGRAAFTLAVSAYSSAGRVERAQQVFDDMVAAGVKPNAVTYTALMSAHAKAGKPDAAERLWAEMRGAGMPPSAAAYAAQLAAACQRAAPAAATQLLRQMAAAGMDGPQEALQPLLRLLASQPPTQAPVRELLLEMAAVGTPCFMNAAILVSPEVVGTRDSPVDKGAGGEAVASVGASEGARLDAGEGGKGKAQASAGVVQGKDGGSLRRVREAGLALLAWERQSGGPAAAEKVWDTVLDTAWAWGQQKRAVEVLVPLGLQQAVLSSCVEEKEGSATLDVRRASPGAALAVAYWWLEDLRQAALQASEALPSEQPGARDSSFPTRLRVLCSGAEPVKVHRRRRRSGLAGREDSDSEDGPTEGSAAGLGGKAVLSLLTQLGFPALEDDWRPGSLVADGSAVASWVMSEATAGKLVLQDQQEW